MGRNEVVISGGPTHPSWATVFLSLASPRGNGERERREGRFSRKDAKGAEGQRKRRKGVKREFACWSSLYFLATLRSLATLPTWRLCVSFPPAFPLPVPSPGTIPLRSSSRSSEVGKPRFAPQGSGCRNGLLKSFAQSRKEAKSQRNRKCR